MNIAELQARFILLAYGECKKYEDIENELKLEKGTASKWYEELRSFKDAISRIRIMYVSRPMELGFQKFYEKIKSLEVNKRCEYCKITELELEDLMDSKKVQTKRTRGRKLELDRMDPNLPYDVLDNLVWACYWCNNAKTDTFTYVEFKEIGECIQKIWNKRKEK